jgi:hypothetical protein
MRGMQNEYYEGLKMLMAASHRQMIVDDVPDGGMLFEWGCGGSSAWIADALAKKGAVIRSVERGTPSRTQRRRKRIRSC